MPAPSSNKPKRPRDLNQLAFEIVQESIGERPASGLTLDSLDTPPKNPAAVALGKLGGKKGGEARAAKLSPEQRSEIAKRAAAARWSRKKNP